MQEVIIIVNDVKYIFEFKEAPTQDALVSAMDTIGGRPKRS